MTRQIVRRQPGHTMVAGLLALSLCGAVQAAESATDSPESLAAHFHTAPESTGPQQQLAQVFVNGVDAGFLQIVAAEGAITLPPETVAALRIDGPPGPLLLSQRPEIRAQFDEAKSVLKLTIPVSMLGPARFSLAPESEIALSPETWGVFGNYDVNVRRSFGTAGSGGASAGGLQWGGLFDLNGLAPDFIAHNGWGYDSARQPGPPLVRLDSYLTWRPASLDLAATAGDIVSDTPISLPAARSYRFGGLGIGSDYSGTPSFTSLPVPSISGTAQAQSAIDVYINGMRQFQTQTSGGPFSLVLPPGATGSPTSIVVTDVTGRNVIVPLEVRPVDVRLLSEGTFLWSTGLGVPRFGFGSESSDYLVKPYAFANGRYGLTDTLALSGHAELGSRLAELEGGVDFAATTWLTTHSSFAASKSDRGAGGFASAGLTIQAPWQLSFDTAAMHGIRKFDDVVSASGRIYDTRHGINPISTLPSQSSFSTRINWQPTADFSLSASAQQTSFIGSPAVGFASLTANYRIADIPTFATVSRTFGQQNSLTVLFGLSVTFNGDIQTSASGGYSTNIGPGSRETGEVSVARPLREDVGDIGWQATLERQPGGNYADASAEIRTGYGIPGIEVNSFAGQTTAYAKARGSVGIVDWHPFVSDPVGGGLVVADGGAPGVPVQLNGYDKGKTSFDGKLLIPDAIPGAPQRVAIDTSRLPLDLVPTDTDTTVVVRSGGAAVASFNAQSAATGAIVTITVDGKPPPIGSNLVSATSSAPIDRRGKAYLPSLDAGEALTVEFADGGSCKVHTDFDGHGGVTRRIGPFACTEAHQP